jgi:type IV pilus assembly protein PilC
VPVFGPIVRKSIIARFARTIGTLLKSGVPIIASLDVASGVVENAVYRENVAAIAAALRNGVSFSDPIAQSGLYEPMFVQLLRVGEETGSLDAMLIRIAEYYELDVETALSALGSIIEPLMIILLGGAVAFIVAAIFVPLYTLIGHIK